MDEENRMNPDMPGEQPVNDQPDYNQANYEQMNNQQERPTYTYEQPVKEPAEKPSGAGFGIAALVLGILALVTFCACINILFAVLAIIFGIIQLVRSSSSAGKGMAIGGLITAGLSIVAMIIFWVVVGASAGNFSDADSIMQYYEQYYEQESPQIFNESGYSDDYDDYNYDYDDDFDHHNHDQDGTL